MSHFVKYHGLGNDYLVVDPALVPFSLTPDAVRLICDRNRGVGSDGILAVTPSDVADVGLRIWNPDGSEAEKSGNGVRIFAKFAREHRYLDRDAFVIETPGGLVSIGLEWVSGRVATVVADMGRARFDPIETIDVDGRRFEITSVSVGNPHCVIVVPDLDDVDARRLGPRIEHHEAFPNRTNVQFAQVMSRTEVRIAIWERGAGYTLASGSSSCAVAAACHRLGLVERDVAISMPGGRLAVSIGPDGDIRMRGPVDEICSGDLSPELIRLLDPRVEAPTSGADRP
jgi:diaminopimelate epimerase